MDPPTQRNMSTDPTLLPRLGKFDIYPRRNGSAPLGKALGVVEVDLVLPLQYQAFNDAPVRENQGGSFARHVKEPQSFMKAQLTHRQQHAGFLEYIRGQRNVRAWEHEVRVMGRVRGAVGGAKGHLLRDWNPGHPRSFRTPSRDDVKGRP